MVLLTLGGAVAAPSLALETRIEVMPVQNRPAESLAQDLQRVLGGGAIVTAASGRVIVNATPIVLARARELLRELDTPGRSLWISVRQDQDASGSYRAGGVSGQVTTGGVSVGVPATTETRRGNTGLPALPVNLLGSLTMLAAAVWLYSVVLPWEGRLLQRREQAILREVTEEVE